jgi:hypothetical protein
MSGLLGVASFGCAGTENELTTAMAKETDKPLDVFASEWRNTSLVRRPVIGRAKAQRPVPSAAYLWGVGASSRFQVCRCTVAR